tara:strand:- start:619 stop:798 length:180 start_codon:yes stop_codon:yes gene_type:complete
MKPGDLVKHKKHGWCGIILNRNSAATNVALVTIWFDVLWEAGNIETESDWDLEVIHGNG